MTVWAVVIAFFGATNPFRRRTALSVPRVRTLVGGAVGAVTSYAVLAIVGANARDTLDVSAPNARIAAGLVLVVVGLHALATAPPAPMPMDDAARAWLNPVWFPVLMRPDLAVVALAAYDAGGVASVAVAATVAFAATVGWWNARGGSTVTVTRVERALGAVSSVALVVAAVRLLLDGVFAL